MGATGFVGGHVVEYLFQQGEISKGAFRKGAHLKIMDLNGVQGAEVDLLDHHSLHEAAEGVDTVYSMASPMPFGDEGFAEVNSKGLMNILEVAREAGVKTLVHLSTLDVYGFGSAKVTSSSKPSPRGEYQQSKLAADSFLLDAAAKEPSPKITIVRAARAFGARDETLAVPLLKMVESGAVAVSNSPALSFTHPKDIAQAMYQAASGGSGGKVYLVKSFDATPMELGGAMTGAMGSPARVKAEGFFAKSKLPRYTAEQLKAGPRLESTEGWAELGYAPKFGLVQTCEEIAKWYRKEPWVIEAH
ncbi:MAG TPA: NAD(P)-dependent oxidoreductase [Nitrososphaerales archaeon]|nr:NAD(P)-dependent oxidoreductase [Nitrososphaerales archaeon]